MKNHPTKLRALFGGLALGAFILFSCTKDFDDIIVDNFGFSFTEEHDAEGVVFGTTRTSFILTPEKEITTVEYYMKYNVLEGDGSFLNIDGETISENDTINLIKHNFDYNYKHMDKGIHRVEVLAWDSNNNSEVIELVYDVKQTNFTFLLNKGSDDFIVNTYNPVIVNLIRDNVNEDSEEENAFEVTYQIENGTAKLSYQEEEYEEGEKLHLQKGESELGYLTDVPGEHKLIAIAEAADGAKVTRELIIKVRNKDYTFIANASESKAFTGNPVPVSFNITEKDGESEEFTMSYTSIGNNSQLFYDGNTYSPGETFSVPTGSFNGVYTGSTDGAHEIVFTTVSTSGVEKTALVNIEYEKYEEFFDLSVSQAAVDKYENQPFWITVVTNANAGHDPNVTYELTYNFVGATAGYMRYKGIIYREGESIPLDYGSTSIQFTPETDENFTINVRVENSTDISNSESEPITMFKKPVAMVKGEKHNVSCGGLNGCDYQVRIYTCWDVACSEAFNGSTIRRVEIRIWNRKDRKWSTFLFNYNDASGSGVNRYFLLEERGKERDLRFLDQRYEVRIEDSNGQWSETVTGNVIRV